MRRRQRGDATREGIGERVGRAPSAGDGFHAPARSARPGETAPAYAALDLGTNNCRLLVARSHGRPGQPGTGLHVIDAFSRIVRLGEGLELSGQLGAPAIERTIAALKICAGKLRRHEPCVARVVATEACRRAGNGDAFLDRVARETGLDIEVIGPGEEALLAVAGCSALLDPARRQAIMFDIGGGSTELMWLEVPPLAPESAPIVLRAWLSLPTGVVSLSERFGAASVSEAGYRAMRDTVAGLLARFDATHGIAQAVAAGGVQMLGSSGTVTTLAGNPSRPAALRPRAGRRHHGQRGPAARGLAAYRRHGRRRPAGASLHRQVARRSGGRRLRHPRCHPGCLAGRPGPHRRSRRPRGHPARPDGRADADPFADPDRLAA